MERTSIHDSLPYYSTVKVSSKAVSFDTMLTAGSGLFEELVSGRSLVLRPLGTLYLWLRS